MLTEEAKKFQSIVIREGKRQHVKSEDVVVGDLVILNVGDRVPGDCLLVEKANHFTRVIFRRPQVDAPLAIL